LTMDRRRHKRQAVKERGSPSLPTSMMPVGTPPTTQATSAACLAAGAPPASAIARMWWTCHRTVGPGSLIPIPPANTRRGKTYSTTSENFPVWPSSSGLLHQRYGRSPVAPASGEACSRSWRDDPAADVAIHRSASQSGTERPMRLSIDGAWADSASG